MLSFRFYEIETQPAGHWSKYTQKKRFGSKSCSLVLNSPNETGASFAETCFLFLNRFFYPTDRFIRKTHYFQQFRNICGKILTTVINVWEKTPIEINFRRNINETFFSKKYMFPFYFKFKILFYYTKQRLVRLFFHVRDLRINKNISAIESLHSLLLTFFPHKIIIIVQNNLHKILQSNHK